MTLLLLLLLRLLTCTVASQQYTLRHADPADSGNVGPWGESLRVQEKVRLISEDGPEFIVKLYEGDIASDARREEVVSLSCERMAISHPPYDEQCNLLRQRIKQLASWSSPTPGWRLPALCTAGSVATRSTRRRGLSFLVLGDSHTLMWRLGAVRTSVPFTIVEAMGATAYGVASNQSKSGARQLFSELLDREEKASKGQKHSHLVVQLGEVDVGSSAWWRAAKALVEERSARSRQSEQPALYRSPSPADLSDEEAGELDVTVQLKEATDRLFEWLSSASAKAGFEPNRVVVMGATLPTVRRPWISNSDADNLDFIARRHVRSSKLSRSAATRFLNKLLREGCERRGFLYADVAAATTDSTTNELRDFFHNSVLNDLGHGKEGSVKQKVSGYDIHLDAFRSYTHFLDSLASAVGGTWCDPRDVEANTKAYGRGKTNQKNIATLYSNARGEFKDAFVRQDPDERSEL